MVTAKGTKKIAIYLGHLINAQKLLETLPDKFYRDLETNKMLNKQKETLKTLESEIRKLIETGNLT